MSRSSLPKSQEPNGEIDLTPMLDVVFIMLIFFIVTATFIKEPGIDVVRPAAKTSEAVTNQNILIAINADGEIWLNKQKLKDHQVSSEIAKMHAENPKGAVVIQADKESTAERVARVIDAAKQAGVSDISLATSK
ncbi:Biopolymer transport protein ExbD [BD1-7 clade bacterium]|uniref:Biopolymer transport protein ExbD n=1 Tax=BD1-7 clade bacterium TaxID=2029982 RepID=A0A5S9N3Z2_9GAMM|nr:Biopolymer transport protein ExbD [BD1-7 clade bacterium]CAA0084497.1 Biopolymer transport protein ExbD [BD1-7 clade bacterium]